MLIEHQSCISVVVFVKDSDTLVSCSEYGTLRKWDVNTGENTLSVKNDYNTFPEFALSHDGQKLAGLSEFSTPYLFDITVPASPKLIKRIHTRRAVDLTFSPDGETIATLETDQTAYLWDMKIDRPKHLNALLREIDTTLWGIKIDRPKLSFKGHKAQIACIAFSPDGKTIATAAYDPNIYLWDVDTGKRLPFPHKDIESIVTVAISPNGELFAFADWRGVMTIYDLNTKKLIRTFEIDNDRVENLEFSSDGKVLYSLSSSAIIMWDMTPP